MPWNLLAPKATRSVRVQVQEVLSKELQMLLSSSYTALVRVGKQGLV